MTPMTPEDRLTLAPPREQEKSHADTELPVVRIRNVERENLPDVRSEGTKRALTPVREAVTPQKLAEALDALQSYETQEIESMSGLKGHEDWLKRSDVLAACHAALRAAEPVSPSEPRFDKDGDPLNLEAEIAKRDLIIESLTDSVDGCAKKVAELSKRLRAASPSEPRKEPT